MRLRGVREPGAGLRLWRPIRSSATSALLHLDHVTHRGELAPQRGAVRVLGGLADPSQAERAEGGALPAADAVRGADLPDPERAGHQAGVSSAAGGCSAAAVCPPAGA